jgi:hypothetical protein
MNEINRIKKDIIMFEENLKIINKNKLRKNQYQIYELSKQYYEDSKYYLKKNDYFTSFGCINYAHGLLDSIIKY